MAVRDCRGPDTHWKSVFAGLRAVSQAPAARVATLEKFDFSTFRLISLKGKL